LVRSLIGLPLSPLRGDVVAPLRDDVAERQPLPEGIE